MAPAFPTAEPPLDVRMAWSRPMKMAPPATKARSGTHAGVPADASGISSSPTTPSTIPGGEVQGGAQVRSETPTISARRPPRKLPDAGSAAKPRTRRNSDIDVPYPEDRLAPISTRRANTTPSGSSARSPWRRQHRRSSSSSNSCGPTTRVSVDDLRWSLALHSRLHCVRHRRRDSRAAR